ncbi:MAG: class I SAM-dependent methyltransferase [Sporichthyaceae bacterium]
MPEIRVPPLRIPRYGVGARFYDVLSAERPVYRTGRLAAVAGLRLHPGARVLDVGCGTGLNLPLLLDAVGDRGAVVGVDASAAMLAQARERIDAGGWDNVMLHQGDAADLATLLAGEAPFDTVLYTYSLSIITNWQQSWAQALALTKPGGRLAVVDLAMPTGKGRVLRPAARVACLTGGVKLRRRVWEVVAADCVEIEAQVLRSGHIHVVSGSKPRPRVRRKAQTAQR